MNQCWLGLGLGSIALFVSNDIRSIFCGAMILEALYNDPPSVANIYNKVKCEVCVTHNKESDCLCFGDQNYFY